MASLQTTVSFHTRNPSETLRLGKIIGRILRAGDVVALAGELGTGKTCLVKGLAAGAGVRDASRVSSPSFALIHEYRGTLPFYHVDLYRLETKQEAEALGLEEYFEGDGVTAIEWADRIPSLLPRDVLWAHLGFVGERSRSITISGLGIRCQEILRELVTVPDPRKFRPPPG